MAKTLIDMAQDLGEIKGKLDLVLENQVLHIKRHDELDARLRSVEQRQYWTAGVSGIIGAAGSYIVTHLSKFST